MGRADDARVEVTRARELAPKDGYTAFNAACVFAQIGDFKEAIECLATAQSRGYYIQSELARNTDLDVLRGLPEFQALAN
jgi:adenylate cyclase